MLDVPAVSQDWVIASIHCKKLLSLKVNFYGKHSFVLIIRWWLFLTSCYMYNCAQQKVCKPVLLTFHFRFRFVSCFLGLFVELFLSLFNYFILLRLLAG